jgi:CheY-like chemotaxis protein
MTTQPAQRMKILWVEDDYYHLKYLARLITKKGFDVVPARSLIEAKELLDNQKFDLVLLDLIIPYSETKLKGPEINYNDEEDDSVLAANGAALLDYVVQELKLNVPIILQTVIMTKAHIDRLMQHGATMSLHKSGLLPEDIERTVMDAIAIHKSTQP